LKEECIPHGFGTLHWKDGASYVGDFVDGKAEGKGTFYHLNSDTYKGDFKQDKAHGFGEYIYTQTNQIYKGNWYMDQ